MASEGWITVIPPSKNHQPRADQNEMIRLAEEAEKLAKGIHNTKVWILNKKLKRKDQWKLEKGRGFPYSVNAG